MLSSNYIHPRKQSKWLKFGHPHGLSFEAMDSETRETAIALTQVAGLTRRPVVVQQNSGEQQYNRQQQDIDNNDHHLLQKEHSNVNDTLPNDNSLILVAKSIGLGIDSYLGGQTSGSTKTDATVAAVKAMQDALQRDRILHDYSHMIRDNGLVPNATNDLFVHIKLGIPHLLHTSDEMMHVDMKQLVSFLHSSLSSSQSIPTIEIVRGGLLVSEEELMIMPGQLSSHCKFTVTFAVIACVTLGKKQSLHHVVVESASSSSLVSTTASMESENVTGFVSVRSEETDMDRSDQFVPFSSSVISEPGSTPSRIWLDDHANQYLKEDKTTSALSSMWHQQQQASHRNTSIEVLAQVSAEMHEEQLPSEALALGDKIGVGDESTKLQNDNGFIDSNGIVNYNYKKLPPGTTPKNNKRLFVQHSYHDYSREVPMIDEIELVGRHAELQVRTPNAAFPLKLHEILTQIELDGHDDIIGWLPHGRSFKIHKQFEFVQQILPIYFVMTKKASFLRQLNLYGFNRLSGTGPDHGSYYHEKFLRGLKFISRRMQRRKVNGKGIRAAGNPDEEPILSSFPSCPPILTVVPTTRREDDHHIDEQLQPRPQTAIHDSTSSSSVTTTRSSSSPDLLAPSSNNTTTRSEFHHFENLVAAVTRTNSPHTIQRPSVELDVMTADQEHDTVLQGGNMVLQVSFPLKLQRILDQFEANNNSAIVTWLSHGRAFAVRNVELFVHEVMSLYFQQTKYSSFQRQLHMYGFQRITSGKDKGAYHHSCFLRGQPTLCCSMHRTRVNGNGKRRPGNPNNEPNLYALTPLPPIVPGTMIEIPTEFSHSTMMLMNSGTTDMDDDASSSDNESSQQ